MSGDLQAFLFFPCINRNGPTVISRFKTVQARGVEAEARHAIRVMIKLFTPLAVAALGITTAAAEGPTERKYAQAAATSNIRRVFISTVHALLAR